MKYTTIEAAADRLCMSPNALRIRCRRAQARNRLTSRVEAELGDGVVAVKFGRSWRVRFPEHTAAA